MIFSVNHNLHPRPLSGCYFVLSAQLANNELFVLQSAIHRSFALGDNLADISAKGQVGS